MSTNRPTTESEELDRDPFEELASEFADRYRNGERPSIEEYASAHPDLADEIRDLFPTIAAMEKTKVRSAPTTRTIVRPPMEGLSIAQLGDFRLIGEIGRGGMGIVYEAEQISLGRHVAVKVLPKQALLDHQQLRRFQREAQTAAKLHHTNIVPVFGVGQQDGYHYIVMQFIPGVGLDEVLLALRRLLFDGTPNLRLFNPSDVNDSSSRMSRANHNAVALLKGNFGDTPLVGSSLVRSESTTSPSTAAVQLPSTGVALKTEEFQVDDDGSTEDHSAEPTGMQALPEEADRLADLGPEFYQSIARIGEQVANALAYAHEQGTLHRDIKPGNLLLDSAGTVWVADFGLAKLEEHDNVSRTGDIVGTLSYIPPESFSGTVDARGDIYSLGLSLFELLTLRPAFYGRDRRQLVREITEGKLPRLSKLNPHLPRDLETIVLKAVAHRPEDRYATAAALASDLNCYLNDRPIMARRMSIAEQFTRWYRKNKLVAALSAAVLSLLMAMTVLFGVLGYQARQSSQLLKIQIEQKDAAMTEAARERDTAETERQKARDFAYDSIQALKSVFAGFRPMKLPVTAGSTLVESDPLQSTSMASVDEMAEATTAVTNTESAGLVAPPPINQETTARLEVLLDSVKSLAAKAENYTDFAATFAELTLQVGILHKTLGNYDRAATSLQRAITEYESLWNQDLTEHTIGLAVSYNEQADLLGSLNQIDEAMDSFHRAEQLLDDLLETYRHSGKEHEAPRAQYELARTMFLMSIQHTRRPNGNPRDRRPPSRNREGGRRPPRGSSSGNLRRAIDLLEPLVTAETNSEYRYLLARCYSSLGVSSPPELRQAYIDKANLVLGELVTTNPGVDDYKYEFAITKLRRTSSVTSLDQRMQLTEEAVELLDQICGRNPDVFNYQIARSRALEQYVTILDRYAQQLETASGSDEDLQLMARILRNDATGEALRAAELFSFSSSRFGEAFVERLPHTSQVALAEVIAKNNSDTAVSHFRNALASNPDFIPQARAQVGLARALMYTNFSEAYQILDRVCTQLYERCQRDLDKFFFDNERFLESFALWAEATIVLEGDLDEANSILQSMRAKRLDTMKSTIPEGFVTFALPVHTAELDLRLAKVYRKVGKFDAAAELQQHCETALQSLLSDASTDGRSIMQKMIVAHHLHNLYFERGDVEQVTALDKTVADLREQAPQFPGRRRPSGPQPAPPPPDETPERT